MNWWGRAAAKAPAGRRGGDGDGDSQRDLSDGYSHAPAQLGEPEGDKRSVTEIEAAEVEASLKWATAKVERAQQRGNGDRALGRVRQAERGGDFNEAPPF